uniref:Uncharacterized protein n=1 Tax=Stegastes partitus TaxID=144197 RepID=A0A3B4ZFD3_9TELE
LLYILNSLSFPYREFIILFIWKTQAFAFVFFKTLLNNDCHMRREIYTTLCNFTTSVIIVTMVILRIMFPSPQPHATSGQFICDQ